MESITETVHRDMNGHHKRAYAIALLKEMQRYNQSTKGSIVASQEVSNKTGTRPERGAAILKTQLQIDV